MDIIPTKAMLLKKNAIQQFTTVVCEQRKKTPKFNQNFAKKLGDQETTKRKKDDDSESELDDIFCDTPRRKKKTVEDSSFNMTRARNEVINFGMSGFDTADKKSAQIALAIKLGAKPPKNKHRNYKEILEEKRKVRLEQNSSDVRKEKRQQFGAEASFQTNAQMYRERQKRAAGGVTASYGNVKKTKLNPNFKHKKTFK
jgi:hypothetical protein